MESNRPTNPGEPSSAPQTHSAEASSISQATSLKDDTLAHIPSPHRWVTERMAGLGDASSDTRTEETDERLREQDDKIEMNVILLEAFSQQRDPPQPASSELDDTELSRRLHQYRGSSDSGVQHSMSKQAGNRAPPPRSLSKRAFDDPDTTGQDVRRRKSNHAPRPSAGTFPEWDESTSGEVNRDPAWRTAPSWRRGTGSEQPPDQTGGGFTSRDPRPQFIPGSTGASLNDPWRRGTGSEQPPDQTGGGFTSRNLRPIIPRSTGASLNDPWRRGTASASTQSGQRLTASAFGHSDAQTARKTLVVKLPFKGFPSTRQSASESQRSHVSDAQGATDDSGIFNFDELLNLEDYHPSGNDHADSPMGGDRPASPSTPHPNRANAPKKLKGGRGRPAKERTIVQYRRCVAIPGQPIASINTLPQEVAMALNTSLDDMFSKQETAACRVTDTANHKSHVNSGLCVGQHIFAKGKGKPKTPEFADSGCALCGKNDRPCVELRRLQGSNEVFLVFFPRHKDFATAEASTDLGYWL
jgi:hypothetical protein